MPMHQTIEPIDATAKAVDALLTAIDGAPAISAVTAYRAALTRHGRQLAAISGPDALAAVLKRVRADAADKAQADERVAIVTEAWAGIAAPTDAAA